MTILEMIRKVDDLLDNRNLKAPQIRKDAIRHIAEFMKSTGKFMSNGNLMLPSDKDTFKESYQKHKGKSLNSAEKSAINHMYDIVHCNAMQTTIAPIKKTAMSKAEELMANSSIISNNKKDRDEDSVIDLCDEVLGLTASRQHRFDFLYGDTGAKLPVDAYYKDLNLVVEYQEIQHTQDVKLFDKRMTVSGVSRKEQRKIYDERRAEILPKYGIKLIIISYTAFGTSKRIKRNRMRDLGIVRSILNK